MEVSNAGTAGYTLIHFLVGSQIPLRHKEVTQLSKVLHQEIENNCNLDNQELAARISQMMTPRNNLLPKRQLRWHLATFGISYFGVKLYDKHRAKNILKAKQKLVDQYLAKMLRSLDPTKENLSMLSVMLEHSNPGNTREILKYALKIEKEELSKERMDLIKKCRGLPMEYTAKEMAAYKNMMSTVYDSNDQVEEKYAIIHKLIENGIDINAKMIDNKTALELACEQNDEEFINELIQAGATIDKYTLISAIEKGHNRAADALLKAGADLDIESPNHFDKNRAILIAIDKQQWYLVDALVKKGADLNVHTNYTGFTPLTLAMTKSAPPEILFTMINALVKAGVSLDTEFTRTPPALALAASKGQVEVVKALVQAGARINIRPNGGLTPLESAIKNGHEEVALHLIEAGANVRREMIRTAQSKNLPRLEAAIRAKILANRQHAQPEPRYKLGNVGFEKPVPFLPVSLQRAPQLPRDPLLEPTPQAPELIQAQPAQPKHAHRGVRIAGMTMTFLQ